MIEQLIQAYKAPEAEFSITLPRGEVLKFKALGSYEDFINLKKEAAKFVKMCRSERCPADYKSLLPESDEVLTSAAVLAATSLEPKFSQLDLLTLAMGAGLLYNSIVEQWEAHQQAKQMTDEVEQIDQLKND